MDATTTQRTREATTELRTINDDNNWLVVDPELKLPSLSPTPEESMKFKPEELHNFPFVASNTKAKQTEDDITTVFRSSLSLTPAISDSTNLLPFVERIFKTGYDVQSLTSFPDENYKEDIINIQSIRRVLDTCKPDSWFAVLPSAVAKTYNKNPRLFFLLAHYLFDVGVVRTSPKFTKANQEIILALNRPTIETLSSGAAKNALLFSFGSFEEALALKAEDPIPPEKIFPKIMTLLSQKKFEEVLPLVEGSCREQCILFVNWVKESNFKTPIPPVSPDLVSHFYDIEALKLKPGELEFLIVFDILCSRNDGLELARFFKEQIENASDELKANCLNSLIQTNRLDLAAAIIGSKGIQFRELASAFAKQNYPEVINKAKVVLKEGKASIPENKLISRTLIRHSLINFFINQKQFGFAKDLLNTSTNLNLRNAIYCDLFHMGLHDDALDFSLGVSDATLQKQDISLFIQAGKYDHALEVLSNVTDPEVKASICCDFINAGEGNLVLDSSLQLESNNDKKKIVQLFFLAKSYPLALALLKSIANPEVRTSIYQELLDSGNNELLLALAVKLENVDDKKFIADLFREAKKYTYSLEVLNSVASPEVKVNGFCELIDAGQGDLVFGLSLELESNACKQNIVNHFFHAEKNFSAFEVLKTITDQEIRNSIYQGLIDKQGPLLLSLALKIDTESDKQFIINLFIQTKEHISAQILFATLTDPLKKAVILQNLPNKDSIEVANADILKEFEDQLIEEIRVQVEKGEYDEAFGLTLEITS